MSPSPRVNHRLSEILRNNLSYNLKLKEEFHEEGKRVLQGVAKALGLKDADRDIRSSFGGIAVSGEVILHSDNLYVQIYQSCCGVHNVMYRRCNGRNDYCGNTNHYTDVKNLEEPEEFVNLLKERL